VREAHEEAIGLMANAFGETLGEKARPCTSNGWWARW
jgi:hypothetical protein